MSIIGHDDLLPLLLDFDFELDLDFELESLEFLLEDLFLDLAKKIN